MSDRRTFEDKPAVLTAVPLWIGIYGATGSGKTFSALRLATGMQRVTGGEIFYIDTEARRALHYAKRFTFRHVEFAAPFSPLDYLEAVRHCVDRGAKVLVIDSMSHEHEGPGGVLEWQAAEEERLAKAWNTSRDKAKMSAWQVPKAARRRMIASLLQLPINIVFCFRAKEKLKIIPGRNPEPLGFMPIAGEELAYEMTATALLYPGADGVPTWASKETGEHVMIKRPEQFRALIDKHRDKPFSEEMGEAFATWAKGDSATPPAKDRPSEPTITPEQAEQIDAYRARFRDAQSSEDVTAIARELASKHPKGGAVRASVNAAYKAADARCKGELPPDAEPAGAA
jgi:energy-coupling factor transporter ATP-binding protein EcfA2